MEDEKKWIFDGRNYDQWAYRMRVLLEEKGLVECIENTINEEDYAEVAGDSAEVKARKKKALEERWKQDRKCKSLIVHRIADSHLEFVMERKTAKECWDSLQNTFQRRGLANRLFYRRKLGLLKLKPGQTMQNHLLEFEKLLRGLRTTGAKVEEDDAITQLLLTLPEQFDGLCTALETMAFEKLSMEFVKNRLLEEEAKRAVKSDHCGDEDSSESAFAGKRSLFKCYNCGKAGHKRSECRAKPSEAGRKPRYFEKSSGQRKGGASSNCATEIAFVAACEPELMAAITKKSDESFQWFLDSGASDHMVKDESCFEELHRLPRKITIAVAKSGQSLVAEFAGTIRTYSQVDGRQIPSVVEEVLYVPGLHLNLFSISRLEDKGMSITFAGGKVAVVKDDQVVATGRKCGRLYQLNVDIRKEAKALLAGQEAIDLWHRRYGHLGKSNLQKLWKEDMIQSKAKLPKCENRGPCEVCLKAKQTRQPFEESDPEEFRSTRVLELVHTDVCGKLNPGTWDRKEYFVTFIDDYTHFTVVYLLETKDQVLKRFKEYKAKVEAYFGVKIAKLRCDNGGEYKNEAFQTLCRQEGIELDFTVPRTPELNGVAERMNRTLLEKSRSMVFDAGLPKSFWGEGVLTAAYLANRSPTVSLEAMKTPYEMWYNKKPNVDNLRVFGSIAYTHISKQLRGKLDPRSEKNIMVGYTTNGYRIWNPRKRQIFVSRDVVFDEQTRKNATTAGSLEKTHDDTDEMEPPEPSVEAGLNDNEPDPVPEDLDVRAEELPPQPVETGGKIESADYGSTDADVPDVGAGPSRKRVHATEESFSEHPPSKRTVKPPTWLEDYHVNNVESTMAYALNAESFVEDIPNNISELKKRDDWCQWETAIKSELESLKKNETWELQPKPQGKNLIGCKWVFRIKRDGCGNIERYKARLVAKGYSQKKDFDYTDTYAPVARITTFRILLSVANHYNYSLHQMDVKTAFLNGSLNEEIYMCQPDGFEEGDRNMVCRLRKSLYGLKQAPRSWNEAFNSFVLTLGFHRSNYDCCLYWRRNEGVILYLLLYVDDILLVSNKLEEVKRVKNQLSEKFEMTDMGEVKQFLGIKVERARNQIKISQPKYIDGLLKRFGMEDCRPVSTPMEPKLKFEQDSKQLTKHPYKELVGCLSYLMLSSRPDISAAVNTFSRYQAAPKDEHWTHLKRILRYLKGTRDLGLVYCRQENAEDPLTGYADADWGSDDDDRRSISGFTFMIFGATVSWTTRKQNTVALSSTEAEYVSLSQATCEAIWLRNVLIEVGVQIEEPIKIFEDNQSCIRIAEEPRDHRRMKHVDIRFHFIRDCIQSKIIQPIYVSTKEQVADILTKGLPTGPFLHLRNKLSLFG